jgi:hypothetical protein
MRNLKCGERRAVFMAAGFFLFAVNIGAQDIGVQGAAIIRELYGTVETRAPGSPDWVRARAGDRVEKNVIISTGFESGAVLAAGDSLVTVRPLTRLSLEEMARDQNEERVSLYLQTGRIRADVKPPKGRKTGFTVRSPIVTASVRGTMFEFDTENLTVTEGEVLYSVGGGRQVSVAGGETSYVDRESNSVVSPFTAASELLTPALPPGADSGSPVTDNPVADRGAPAPIPLPALIGLDFGWD